MWCGRGAAELTHEVSRDREDLALDALRRQAVFVRGNVRPFHRHQCHRVSG
jgi:hypothetical protein